MLRRSKYGSERKIFRNVIFLVMIAMACTAEDTRGQLSRQDTVGFSWSASFTMSWNKGNVDRLITRTSAGAAYLSEKFGTSFDQQYIFGTFSGRQTESDLSSRNFLYVTPLNAMYPYVMGWISTSRRRNIDLRVQLGPGVSWDLLQREKHLLKVSLTGTYEQTNFSTLPMNLSFENQSVWRATGRIFGYHELASGKVNVRYEVWHQQALSEAADYRYLTELDLSIPLSKQFSFRTSVSFLFENMVAPNVEQGDFFWTSGLTFNSQ